MRNYSDEDDDYNYSPNELAHLSIKDSEKYRSIVRSNIDEDDSVDEWERRNMESAQKFLNEQRFYIGRRT